MYRILHVLGGMGIGGIETWLMRIYRKVDKSEIQFDFLVTAKEEQTYDQEIKDLGGRIFKSPNFGALYSSSKIFIKVVKEFGPFHAIHVHGRSMIGWQLGLARFSGIKTRIAHVHNLDFAPPNSFYKKLWVKLNKLLILRNSSWILGCSPAACDSLIGKNSIERFNKVKYLPYGLDLGKFKLKVNPELRKELNLEEDAFVVGHIGSFRPEKNHSFILEIFRSLQRNENKAKLVLIGGGNPKSVRKIQSLAAELGIQDYVLFLGQRQDVIRLIPIFDVFLFPSLSEGFGIVVLENQTLGVPTVVSDKVPVETSIIKEISFRVGLNEPIDNWVAKIIDCKGAKMDPRITLKLIESSAFNINRCLETLLNKYYRLNA